MSAILISLVSYVLVIAGVFILLAALGPLQRLIQALSDNPLRNRWRWMTGLILGFLVGYVGFAMTLHQAPIRWTALVVAAVFFFGAIFVWLAVTLALHTMLQVMEADQPTKEAVTDPLTDVFNRRYLDRRLVEEIERARRYDLPLSVLLLDIDDFERVNTELGHQTADQVLITLAQLLQLTKRETDVLARYGGGEFMLIAPHTHACSAIKLAERLRRCIETHDFAPTERRGSTGARAAALALTGSIGVASLSDPGADSVSGLVAIADANLYRAKREGRNRVVANDSASAVPA